MFFLNRTPDKTVVFTNGCFDIIHVGHVGLLEFAANYGQLIVGLNSDQSVKKLKGDSRPINNEIDRMKVLKSMSAVSEVILFNEDTPYELIKKIKPHLIVKGGDYTADQVIGSDLCKVMIYPYHKNYSTSSIINKLGEGNL
jgi:D-beta-D-heptose 7-phosphate kinase/D-beta-D-heptose 1-phosphate adenosyltransferase